MRLSDLAASVGQAIHPELAAFVVVVAFDCTGTLHLRADERELAHRGASRESIERTVLARVRAARRIAWHAPRGSVR